MKKDKYRELRLRAEKAVKDPGVTKDMALDDFSIEEAASVINELRVYQVELEIQNEELIKKQIEIEKSRDQYWKLFHLSPVGYLMINESGLIIEANTTFGKMVAMPRDKIIGKALVNFISKEFHEYYWSRFRSFYRQPNDKTFEVQLLNENNELFWVLISGCPYSESKAEDDSLLINIINIDSKKLLEIEQKRLNDRMNHFQRLESLGILAGGIAHDFNNMLTVIRANAELISLRDEISKNCSSQLNDLFLAVDRSAKLTSQMLTYAGKGFFSLQLSDIGREVELFKPLLRSSVSAEINLNISYEKCCYAECDVSQIHQILMNSVINASEAISPNYGNIELKVYTTRLENFNFDNFKVFPELPFEKYVCIEINDDGCGIDAETMNKIFDPFFSTKFTGRGLGMAAVLGVVKQHLGGIYAESKPGEGSRFCYFIPFAKNKCLEDEALQPRAGQNKLDWQGVALVIDDDDSIRDVQCAFLRKLGFNPFVAGDGQLGLLMLEELSDDVSILVLDLCMPKLNGLDFFRRLRETRKELPVIFCTGHAPDSIPEEFLNEKNTGFLPKPFSFEELEKVIAELL